jgi:hypothetical protein
MSLSPERLYSGRMIHKILLLSLALVAPLALRAQTSTPSAVTPAAQPVEDPASRSLDNDPDFKKLSPEMQERVRQFQRELNEAIAAAKNDSAKDTAIKQLDSPPLKYTYAQAAPSNTPPPASAQPAKPSPCVVSPKKPSLLTKLKTQAEQALKKQAGKADAQITKQTGGKVDAGVQDATTTAVNQANQPDPCPPAKPAKQ